MFEGVLNTLLNNANIMRFICSNFIRKTPGQFYEFPSKSRLKSNAHKMIL